MHKRHLLRIALLASAIALTMLFAFVYHFRAYIGAWFWTAEEPVVRIVQTFVVRLLERPFYGILNRMVWVLTFGYNFRGKLLKRLTTPLFATLAWAWREWKALRAAPKFVVGVALAGLGAFITWSEWQFMLFLPFGATAIKSADYWLFDRFFDKTTHNIALKQRRFVRTNALMRRLRAPWRAFWTPMVKASERWRENRQSRHRKF